MTRVRNGGTGTSGPESPPAVVLLGPQRLRPTLIDAVRFLGIEGRIATVTAGWQEREPEDAELHQHLEGRSVNLKLYQRTEELIQADTELAEAHRQRQETLKRVQEVHQLRLAHALDAARELLRRQGDKRFLGPERLAAIESIRTLDQEHAGRIRTIHREFDARIRPLERPAVSRHRQEIGSLLRGAAALAIAGGHIAVLLNRLRFFGLSTLIGGLPVLAWSAGAMAISERVVLFHDNPPQGPGNAEVLDEGLGLVKGVVPLPHARRRLRLDDPALVALFARRFQPAASLLLDDGAWGAWRGGRLSRSVDLSRLTTEGDVEALQAS